MPRTFSYDAFSRMTGATNGSTSVVYTYDAVGRKVKRLKRDAAIYPDSTYYIYDGLDPVCMVEFNPAHTECTTVTWLVRGLGVAPGIGNIVAQQRYTINFNGTASTPVLQWRSDDRGGQGPDRPTCLRALRRRLPWQERRKGMWFPRL